MNVLIVDDEPLARERLSRLVGDLDGYRVLEPAASNGEEALTLIEELRPDIVLLDIRMPGLDGLQVAARLCETDAPPAVIFVLPMMNSPWRRSRSARLATWSSRCARSICRRR